MAEKLSVTIALEGAEEIKRQLADVGKAGQDAFKQINDAAAQVGGFNKLDPGVVTEKLKAVGDVGSEAFNKVAGAVKAAGRMETLIAGLTGVENGLAKVQATASAVDGVLGKSLVRSLTMVARLLPAAFAAATIGAIANTTNELLKLDAAAIKLGVSIGDLAKAQEIFKQIGIGSEAAAKGVASFFEKMQLDKVKEAAGALDEFGRSAKTGANWLKILQDAAKGSGEAADLARAKLKEMGRLGETLSPAAKAIDEIKKSAMSLPDQLLAIIGVLQKMGDTAERDRLIFANFDKDFAVQLIQGLNAGIPAAELLGQRIAALTPPSQEAAQAAFRVQAAWNQLKNLFASGFEVSPQGLNQIAQAMTTITGMLPTISAGMKSAFGGDLLSNTARELNTIATAFSTLRIQAQSDLAAIGQFFSTLRAQAQSDLAAIGQSGIWQSFKSGAAEAVNYVLGLFSSAAAKIKSMFSGVGAGAAIPDAGGFARGGLMGGRGSGTSDSNLAWLSRGEHVMPAYAVRQPGVLQLLEALRRSGGNLRGVLDRMGHFALGGMVGATPAFAGGGMNHVTIAFPGLAPISGLRASSAVVDELHRAAALAQVRSGGRKPSRYF